MLEPEVDRKVQPSPFDDIEPVKEVWQVIASIAVGFVLFGVALFAALMFATGAWIWSLLI
jgi:hypothetical protein